MVSHQAFSCARTILGLHFAIKKKYLHIILEITQLCAVIFPQQISVFTDELSLLGPTIAKLSPNIILELFERSNFFNFFDEAIIM